MDHFMHEHPVFFCRRDVGIAAHADENQPAILGISDSVANAGAGRAAHFEREVRNREVSIVVGDGVCGILYPAQQFVPRELDGAFRQRYVDGGAGNL